MASARSASTFVSGGSSQRDASPWPAVAPDPEPERSGVERKNVLQPGSAPKPAVVFAGYDDDGGAAMPRNDLRRS